MVRRLLLLSAALLILPLQANDTAINGGGYGPAPLGEFKGEESVIRMVSESIDIRFAKKESQVHCRFTFRSGKKGADAKQTVGFPDLLRTEQDAGDIHHLETTVNGEKVEARKERGWFYSGGEMPRSGLGEPPKDLSADHITRADFYVVEVTFPPDKDVVIERTYLASSGGDVMGAATFAYTTATGAIWQGNIGQADFHVTLDDGLMVDDLAFEDGPQKIPAREQTAWCSPNKAEWTILSSKEMKMTWKDFEPAVHRTRRGIQLATWVTRRAGE